VAWRTRVEGGRRQGGNQEPPAPAYYIYFEVHRSKSRNTLHQLRCHTEVCLGASFKVYLQSVSHKMLARLSLFIMIIFQRFFSLISLIIFTKWKPCECQGSSRQIGGGVLKSHAMCRQVAEDTATPGPSESTDETSEISSFSRRTSRREYSATQQPGRLLFLRFWKHPIVSAVVHRWIACFSSR
jgi:hypothetical protein